MIREQDVEHVARLARLALDDAEKTRMAEQLGRILAYVDKLKQLDVDGVEPTSHAVPMINVMRDDEVEPSLERERMMANAPERVGEFFRVPRIIED
jgi:aspartyl-tRNA(Asn)/glutamyl-tRNA(Gln) amidotransferase subunit C